MLACRTGCLMYRRMTGRRLTNGPTVFVIVLLLIDLGSAASVLKGRDICFGRLQAFYITRRSCFERGFYGGFHGFFQWPGERTQLSIDSTCRQGYLCKLCCFEKHTPCFASIGVDSRWRVQTRANPIERNRSPTSTLPTPRKPKFTIAISKSFTVEKSVKLSGGRRVELSVTGRPRWCLFKRKISDDVCDKRSSEQPVGRLACDEMRQSTMSLTLRIDRVSVPTLDICAQSSLDPAHDYEPGADSSIKTLQSNNSFCFYLAHRYWEMANRM